MQAALGDDDAAITSYRRAIALAPTNPAFHESLGYALLSAERPLEALAAFQRAVDASPGRAETHHGLAYAYHARKRYAEAITAHERAFALGSRDLPALLRLCDDYRVVAAYGQSARCLKQVLAQDPGNADARSLLDDVQRDLDRSK